MGVASLFSTISLTDTAALRIGFGDGAASTH
jgi:hypothetical protein